MGNRIPILRPTPNPNKLFIRIDAGAVRVGVPL
jgi:hypothetical protein